MGSTWEYNIARNTLGNPCPNCDQAMSMSITIVTGQTANHKRETGAALWMQCNRCNHVWAGFKAVPTYDPDGLQLIGRDSDDDDYDDDEVIP